MKVIVWVCIFLVCISLGYGYPGILKLSTIKPVYEPGDRLTVFADVNNPYDYFVKGSLNSLVSCLDDSDFPSAIIPIDFVLKPGEQKRIEVQDMLIEKEFPSGRYALSLNLFMDGMLVEEQEMYFNVEGTLKELDFEISVCKDRSCKFKSGIFALNDKIYLDYETSASQVNIVGKIIYPDETTEEITLPKKIIADQLGTYNLELTASKEGYKAVELKEQFGVIEEITMKDFIIEQPGVKPNWIYVIIGIIAIAIVLLVIIRRIVKRRKDESQGIINNENPPIK